MNADYLLVYGLIGGATGYLGSRFVAWLKREPTPRVRSATVRDRWRAKERAQHDAEQIEEDLRRWNFPKDD